MINYNAYHPAIKFNQQRIKNYWTAKNDGMVTTSAENEARLKLHLKLIRWWEKKTMKVINTET